MNMQIDQARLEKAVVQQVIDYFVDDEKTFEKIRNDISARIDKLFADHATDLVKKMAEDAVLNGFEREYVKIDQWGQKAGEPTSIKKELERMVSAHWSERVDLKGNSTNSSYNSTSRAEYLMNKICAADFSKTMQEHATNITGHLKDGLRTQLAAHMDIMLSDLFRVKSLQDQGKVEKPW